MVVSSIPGAKNLFYQSGLRIGSRWRILNLDSGMFRLKKVLIPEISKQQLGLLSDFIFLIMLTSSSLIRYFKSLANNSSVWRC